MQDDLRMNNRAPGGSPSRILLGERLEAPAYNIATT
jgi:hypothetical protein